MMPLPQTFTLKVELLGDGVVATVGDTKGSQRDPDRTLARFVVEGSDLKAVTLATLKAHLDIVGRCAEAWELEKAELRVGPVDGELDDEGKQQTV